MTQSITNKKLVLATKSPARIYLLQRLGIDFIVIEPKTTEAYRGLGPREIVLENARKKALNAMTLAPENSVITAFDTIILDSKYRIIGKPKTVSTQAKILEALSGSWHKVITGAYIIDLADNTTDTFTEETRVKLKQLTPMEIQLYAASLEGLNKAGGYAIQGTASLLVEKIEGDYYNIIGLPLHKLYTTLQKHGINLLEHIVKKRVIEQKKKQ